MLPNPGSRFHGGWGSAGPKRSRLSTVPRELKTALAPIDAMVLAPTVVLRPRQNRSRARRFRPPPRDGLRQSRAWPWKSRARIVWHRGKSRKVGPDPILAFCRGPRVVASHRLGRRRELFPREVRSRTEGEVRVTPRIARSHSFLMLRPPEAWPPPANQASRPHPRVWHPPVPLAFKGVVQGRRTSKSAPGTGQSRRGSRTRGWETPLVLRSLPPPNREPVTPNSSKEQVPQRVQMGCARSLCSLIPGIERTSSIFSIIPQELRVKDARDQATRRGFNVLAA
jgi:hypothetical protein